MRITVHQPEHWPWLGFFHKVTEADQFVILDSVQYRHRYFQNRNKIKSPKGAVWINIPVRTKGRRFQKIKDVQINNDEPWQRKCFNSISINYTKTPYYKDYIPHIKELYDLPWKWLIDFNVAAVKLVLKFINYNIPIILSSEIGILSGQVKDILGICKKLKADQYISGISGIGGRGHGGERDFAKENIKVTYQEFHHPIYQQLYGDFIPCLSVLDLLFNCGSESLNIMHGKGVLVMEEVFH